MGKIQVGLMWSTGLDNDFSIREIADLNRQVGHNTGNVAFVHAIRKLVGSITTSVDWSSSAVSDVDVLVFPGANQIGSHTNLGDLANNMLSRGKPIVAIGIGAQSKSFNEDPKISDGTRQFLTALTQLSPNSNSNIWTRGGYSASQVAKNCSMANPVVGCCPSLFISPDKNLGSRLSSKPKIFRRIAVAGGNPGFKQMRLLERDLVQLVDSSVNPGCYITQSMIDMIQLGVDSRDQIGEATLNNYREFLLPSVTNSQFIEWCRSYVRSYFDARSWMLELSRYDVVVGARYHGVALGIQAGVPGMIFEIDSRTSELGESSGIPTVLPSDYDYLNRRTLESIWSKFDPDKFDDNRIMQARRFFSFLINNGLEPSDHLKSLVD